jgi:hypothetical protein
VLWGLGWLGLGLTMGVAGTAETAPDAAPPIECRASVRRWSASLRWENDTFSGDDRFYSDGISLAITHTGPSWMDPVADRLPWGEGRRTVGYDAGQIMVTPADTTLSVPDPNDRPYAGILWFGLALHVEKEHTYNGLKFITGVVGPASLAAETQRLVHEILGNDYPQGWDYQLPNEPIFNLVYEHRRRYRLLGEADGLSVEVLPMGNLMLGNVLTQAQVGGQIRFGWRIPNDYGTTLMRGMVHLPPPFHEDTRSPWKDWGVYAYGGGNLNFVARNISLDGSTWRDSPSVDKEWFVPAAEVGVAASSGKFLFSFSYVFWGREFENQQDYTEFGTVTFTWLF